MDARILLIEEKLRSGPGMVRPSDFRVRDGGAVDPRIILQQPNLSLYCLDFEKRQVLFVETPPECDLSQAPFLYEAQYEAAVRLIQVPYETLHRLAAEVVIDPSKLILIYSVGRCGSTLVSRAFSEINGVESISEPDVFTQMLGVWGANELEGTEKADLLRSCTLLQCVPGRINHATAWALKFRSMVTAMIPLFYSVFPEAKIVFLYRHAEPWARSFLRVMQVTDPTALVSVAETRELFGRAIPLSETRERMPSLDMLADMWVSVMEACLTTQRRGIPLFIARYEELNTAPHDVLTHMFAHCGLAANAVGSLDAVLGQDSQAGSSLSRDSLAETPTQLSQGHRNELRRLIEGRSGTVTADTILPDTYFPGTTASTTV